MKLGRLKHVAVGLVLAAASALVLSAPEPAAAVETAIAIDTSAIAFGDVEIASTAQMSVTLTNTGAAPFGPINLFGGAPPTAQFGAGQNCQAQVLASGASCTIEYQFAPDADGPFSDESRFTMSPTNSQADGEDFVVALTGTGCQVGACNGATTTTTSTTTAAGSEPAPASGTPMAPSGQTPSPAPGQPAVVPAGQPSQPAPAGEPATEAPTDDTADESTTLDEPDPTEDLERAQAEIEEDDDGTNWILPTVTLLVVVLLAAGAIVLAYRAGRSSGASHPNDPPTRPAP